MESNKISKDCIHCGLCTKNCDFLKEYKLDLAGFEERSDLAYNCFMCGKCKIVCPKDIDGRLIAKSMRDEKVAENNGKVPGKGYGGLVFEKKNYIFKNYKNVDSSMKNTAQANKDSDERNSTKTEISGKSVLFTGCNFLSYMPYTAERLIEEMNKKGIGVVFDCCGKPIYELGLNKESEDIIKNLEKRLKDNNITELIMVCPNCYYYLRGKIDVRMVDIYTKIQELGIGKELEGDILAFRPCPDREEEILLNKIKEANENLNIECVKEQCCGAGGCAPVKEPGIAQNMRKDVKSQVGNRHLSTYCSTCFGFFRSEGIDVSHILSDLLGVKEENPGNSLMNRMKFKFYKNK